MRLSMPVKQPFSFAQTVAFLRSFPPCQGDLILLRGLGRMDELPAIGPIEEQARRAQPVDQGKPAGPVTAAAPALAVAAVAAPASSSRHRPRAWERWSRRRQHSSSHLVIRGKCMAVLAIHRAQTLLQ